jgi:hypothetical protein
LIITKKNNVAGLPVPRHREVKSKEKSVVENPTGNVLIIAQSGGEAH